MNLFIHGTHNIMTHTLPLVEWSVATDEAAMKTDSQHVGHSFCSFPKLGVRKALVD